MKLLNANLVLSVLSLSALQASALIEVDNYVELAEKMGFGAQRKLRKQVQTLVSPTGEVKVTKPEGRELFIGPYVSNNPSDFAADGGSLALGHCEGFEADSGINLVLFLPLVLCFDNPVSSTSLGGCLTSMKSGLKIGSTMDVTVPGAYDGATYGLDPSKTYPLALVEAPIGVAMGMPTATNAIGSLWTADIPSMEFDPPATAVSFNYLDVISLGSADIQVYGVDDTLLATVTSGGGLSFVGIVSPDEPIGRIAFPPGVGILDYIDNVCWEKDLNGEGGGDPHFKTLAGGWFDYHGACDLVMLQAPNFGGPEQPLSINVRTKIRDGYSFIEQAALSIGEETFEVSSFGSYALNGVEDGAMPATLAGFPVTHTQLNEKTHVFEIDLGRGENIVFKTFKDMVTVKVNHLHNKRFRGAKGMMGSVDDEGAMISRDGLTLIEDPIAFANEWQVREDEPMIFRSAQEPQAPNACVLPEPVSAASVQRRLAELGLSEEDAELACANWPKESFEMCVHDVLATGDLDFAAAGAF